MLLNKIVVQSDESYKVILTNSFGCDILVKNIVTNTEFRKNNTGELVLAGKFAVLLYMINVLLTISASSPIRELSDIHKATTAPKKMSINRSRLGGRVGRGVCGDEVDARQHRSRFARR